MKTIAEQKEMEEIRKVSAGFTQLIADKQKQFNQDKTEYGIAELLKGTPYEKTVAVQGNMIEWYPGDIIYHWAYTPRVGRNAGFLTEVKGFE